MNTAKGAPYMDNSYVSISHTCNILVMAFSCSPIGIDIEKANRRIKIGMTIEEWTKYEAYSKLIGEGLSKRLLLNKLPDISYETKYIMDKQFVMTVCQNVYQKIITKVIEINN